VSGITELIIDIIYSKEIPYLQSRLGENILLCPQLPAASIVTVQCAKVGRMKSKDCLRCFLHED
jgi:hypothetical protein